MSVTAARDPTTIVTVSHTLRAAIAIPENVRAEEQKKNLAEYYRSIAPSLKAARLRLTGARKALDDLGIASTLVMRDKPSFERPSTYLRVRGNYLL